MSDKYDSECDFVIEDEVEEGELSDEISSNILKHNAIPRNTAFITSRLLVRKSRNILVENLKRAWKQRALKLSLSKNIYAKKEVYSVVSEWPLASEKTHINDESEQEDNSIQAFECVDGIDSNASVEELMEKYKSIKYELDCLEKENTFSDEVWENENQTTSYTETSIEIDINSNDLEQNSQMIHSIVIPIANTSVAHKMPLMKEDDEDSELQELRLQALASRPKPNETVATRKVLSNKEYTENKENVPLCEKVSSAYSVAQLKDNYEIIDMELDTDEEVLVKANVLSASTQVKNEEELDLEAEKLRTQLLESLNTKKLQLTRKKSEMESNNSDSNFNSLQRANMGKCKNKVPSIAQGAKPISVISSGVVLQENNASSKRRKLTYNHLYKKENITTHHSSSLYSKPTPFIINLHEDSSTDEEDAEAKQIDMNKKAALESLERLIDSAKNSSTAVNESDNTVSVLSTALPENSLSDSQREEYSNLNKVLTQIDSLKEEDKHNAWNAYNLLTEKLKKAKSMDITHNETLKMAKIQSNEKKLAFITSQVEVRRLQEQLTVAFKVKEINETSMFLANSHLQAVQNTILKSKILIRQLEGQRSKLAQQIFSGK